jgi:hypothetical protein
VLISETHRAVLADPSGFTRFLVASRAVRDLLLCAKHLFIAAISLESADDPRMLADADLQRTQ